MTINAQNVMDFMKKVKSGYVAQCAKIGITKNYQRIITNCQSENYCIFFKNFT